MDTRTITSMNFLLGTLAIGLAVLFPFAQNALMKGGEKTSAELQVMNIVRAQQQHMELKENYVYFSGEDPAYSGAMKELNLSPSSGNFIYEAYAETDNALVIRAVTKPGALRTGSDPMVYYYRIKNKGETGQGEWKKLSSRKSGLL